MVYKREHLLEGYTLRKACPVPKPGSGQPSEEDVMRERICEAFIVY